MDKNLNEKRVNNPSPQEHRKELEEYIAHVTSHAPEDLRFTIMMAGHEQEGSMHMCAMIGGPPPVLMRGMIEIMKDMTTQNPDFGIAFLLAALQNLKASGIDAAVVPLGPDTSKADLDKYDLTGNDDTASVVENLLRDLQNNKGGLH